MTTIIVTHENNETDEHDFASEISTITIGRRSTNDVCVPNLSVSGSHARIKISDTGSMIEDLSSTNGTYINGRLISRQLLNDGDDIVLGKVRLTFLQPQSKHTATPDLPMDETDPDEIPLTLAEKARLHRQANPPKGAPLDDVATQQEKAHQPATAANFLHAESDLDDPVIETRADASENAPEFEDDIAAVPEFSPKNEFFDEEQDDGATVLLNRPVTTRDASARVTQEQTTKAAHDTLVTNRARSQQAVADSGIRTDAALTAPFIAQAPQQKTDSAPVALEPRAEDSQATHVLDDAGITAVIEIKNGAKSGQVLPIDKPVTTLGRPGIQIAAIMKKPEGYFLMHIESDENVEPPSLNSNAIGDEPVLLASGDALNVAGIDVQFMQT